MTAAFTTNLDRFSEIRSLAREDVKNVEIPATMDHIFVGYGMTAMMAVSYIAGEPLSNAPRCTAPFLSIFVKTWGDSLRRHEREDLLIPLLPALVDARGGGEHYLPSIALDWLLRENLSLWLRAVRHDGCREHLAVVPSQSDTEMAERLSHHFDTTLNSIWDRCRSRRKSISKFLPFDPYRPQDIVRTYRVSPESAESAAISALAGAYGPGCPLMKVFSQSHAIVEACKSVKFFECAYDSIRASTRDPNPLPRDEIIERARRDGEESVRSIGLRAQGSAFSVLRRMIEIVG